MSDPAYASPEYGGGPSAVDKETYEAERGQCLKPGDLKPGLVCTLRLVWPFGSPETFAHDLRAAVSSKEGNLVLLARTAAETPGNGGAAGLFEFEINPQGILFDIEGCESSKDDEREERGYLLPIKEDGGDSSGEAVDETVDWDEALRHLTTAALAGAGV